MMPLCPLFRKICPPLRYGSNKACSFINPGFTAQEKSILFNPLCSFDVYLGDVSSLFLTALISHECEPLAQFFLFSLSSLLSMESAMSPFTKLFLSYRYVIHLSLQSHPAAQATYNVCISLLIDNTQIYYRTIHNISAI